MFETTLPQQPVPAFGPSMSPDRDLTARGRRRTLRAAKLLSCALMAAVASAFVVLAGNMLGNMSAGRVSLALIAMWLVVFLGMSLFARATARLALRVLRSFHGQRRSQQPALSDQELFALSRRNPQVASDVQALLDADAATDEPAVFIAPRYCRYL